MARDERASFSEFLILFLDLFNCTSRPATRLLMLESAGALSTTRAYSNLSIWQECEWQGQSSLLWRSLDSIWRRVWRQLTERLFQGHEGTQTDSETDTSSRTWIKKKLSNRSKDSLFSGSKNYLLSKESKWTSWKNHQESSPSISHPRPPGIEPG